MHRWEDLHASLVGVITSWHGAEQFQRLRALDARLARFASPESLLEYLNQAAGDLDDKDLIYAALVNAMRKSARVVPVARALVWCGLWPRLDRFYGYRISHYRDDPYELTQSISIAFLARIKRLQLGDGSRVAATIVRSTERDARRWLSRMPATSVLAHRSTGQSVEQGVVVPNGSSKAEQLAADDGRPIEEQLDAIRERLRPLIGTDSEIVLAISVLDFDSQEVANLLGIKRDAARKRVQRAIEVLREKLARFAP